MRFRRHRFSSQLPSGSKCKGITILVFVLISLLVSIATQAVNVKVSKIGSYENFKKSQLPLRQLM